MLSSFEQSTLRELRSLESKFEREKDDLPAQDYNRIKARIHWLRIALNSPSARRRVVGFKRGALTEGERKRVTQVQDSENRLKNLLKKFGM